MTILDEIVETVKNRVEGRSDRLQEDGVASFDGRSSLRAAIRGSAGAPVIGELKKSSPSSGEIRSEFEVKELSRSIYRGGASGVSVLTEPEYFDGNLDYIEEVKKAVEIPVLRKDFIVSKSQLRESAKLGADAVLLIAHILGDNLSEFVDLAHSLGMETLVEVSDEDQVRLAESTETDLIGINNRNLETMSVNLERTRKVIEGTSDKSVIVSESGISDREDVERVMEWGVDAVLVGTAIMESRDVEGKVRELVHGDENDKD